VPDVPNPLGHVLNGISKPIENGSGESPCDALTLDEYFPLFRMTELSENLRSSGRSCSLVILLDPEGEGATIPGTVGSSVTAAET
jgi:hypothetical protein